MKYDVDNKGEFKDNKYNDLLSMFDTFNLMGVDIKDLINNMSNEDFRILINQFLDFYQKYYPDAVEKFKIVCNMQP